MIKILSVEIKSLNLGTLHRNTRTANIFINDLKCFQKKKSISYFRTSNTILPLNHYSEKHSKKTFIFKFYIIDLILWKSWTFSENIRLFKYWKSVPCGCTVFYKPYFRIKNFHVKYSKIGEVTVIYKTAEGLRDRKMARKKWYHICTKKRTGKKERWNLWISVVFIMIYE